jgi:hypothetical protein
MITSGLGVRSNTVPSERSLKGRLNYPSIQILFYSRDMSLALAIQSSLGSGSLLKKKGAWPRRGQAPAGLTLMF